MTKHSILATGVLLAGAVAFAPFGFAQTAGPGMSAKDRMSHDTMQRSGSGGGMMAHDGGKTSNGMAHDTAARHTMSHDTMGQGTMGHAVSGDTMGHAASGDTMGHAAGGG